MIKEKRWKPELPDLKNDDRISIDIETCDPDLKELGCGVRRNGYMVGMSVAVKRDNEYLGWYIPIKHKIGDNVDYDVFVRWANENLTNEKQDKIFTNCLYDLDYLTEIVDIKGRFIDILNAEPLIDENARKYGLDTQAKKYLGYGKDEKELEDYVKSTMGQKADVKGNIWAIPARVVRKYAEMDAIEPLMIFEKQEKILEEEELMGIFNLETDLVPMLLNMKKNGVRVDTEKASKIETEYIEHIKKDKVRLNEIAGYEVNYNSADSISKYLDANGIKYNITQKSRKASITKQWLDRQDGEFFELIRRLRQDERISNAFVEGMILKYSVKGRIHCQFNQLKGDEYGTVSGRFSSSLPNLQQVPSPDKSVVMGPLIRSLFIPEEGHEWVSADYSQIEPRLTLHYGRGQEAEKARNKLLAKPDADIYSSMVEELSNYDLNINKDVINDKKLFRKMTKTVFLGITYSMGVNAICQRLGLGQKDSMDIVKAFNSIVPYVKELSDRAKNAAETRGYVKTIMGRKSRFNLFEPRGNFGVDRMPALQYEEAFKEYGSNIQRAFCYRALNRIIQGGSADIMKKSMVDIWKSGICDVVKMHLTVHDEIDFSCPKNKIGEEAKKEINYMMENVMEELSVPLKVDMECSDHSWGYVK